MRLINNSVTRNIFESLNQNNPDEKYLEGLILGLFDGTDFFVNDIISADEETGIIKLNITAFNSDGEELNRDIEIKVPEEEYDGVSIKRFNEVSVEKAVEDWISNHNSPDSFYEGVMINTGSTTVTSDETGVTVEDNGNTITTGNGVTVDINNEDDVLPTEMDIAEHTEELPVDEPVEEIPEEIPEELPEEPTEELPEEPTEDEEDLDESAVNEEVLEKKTDETEEEVNNSKVEECDKSDKKDEKIEEAEDIKSIEKQLATQKKLIKDYQYEMNGTDYQEHIEKIKELEDKLSKLKLKEADGYNQNQNVEIYQNPEFDYQILDITELDNTDTGDVRAIDMANILNDLDESLTEAIGTNNWGEINSFLTRKGTHKKTNESYSSAILELTLPRLNESIGEYKNVFMLEVYGNGPIKECIVRDSKSHIIKEYSGKSKNPVKHFEGVIFDIMNSRMLNEEVVPMVNEPMEDKGVNFADSKAIDKDEERQEKHLKQHANRNKENKKFKIEKEPDQENTTGKTEEELTDTAEVGTLPKAKKTKVDAEKLKVKEIKESKELNEMGNFAGRMDTLKAASDREALYRKDVSSQKNKKIEELFSRLKEIQDDVAELKEIDRHINLYNLKDKYGIWLDASGRGLDYENPEENSKTLFVDTDKILMAEPSLGATEITVEELTEPNPFHSKNVFIKLATEMLDNYPSYIKAVNKMIDDYDLKYPVKSQDGISESVKLKEEDELLDEPIVTDGTEPKDELEESGSNVATFHRKPASVDAMRAAEQNGITVNKSNYKIIGTKELSNDEFNDFANHLSSKDYDWLQEYNDTSESGEFKCVEVINLDDSSYSILVDPQGYSYARYAAIKENTDEEELLEPEEEELLEPENEEVE